MSDEAKSDEPKKIANFLIREHGIGHAMDKAVEGTSTANRQGDNYGLSVWREVKRILRERTDTTE